MKFLNRKRAAAIAAVAGVLAATALSPAQDSRPHLSNAPELSLPRSSSATEADARVEAEIREGHFAEAEAAARFRLRAVPGSADTRYLLAYALMRQGKAKEALGEYTRAASGRRPTADELRGVAQAYVLLDDLDDADRWLTLSLQMDPRSADTWYNLGRLRYTQNRFADAVECYQRVFKLMPGSVKAENNLGLAYEGLNRTHEAELAYRQAIAWQDAGPAAAASEQPLLNLAILLLHGADPGQAEPLLTRAAAIAPKDPRIHEQLGQLYVQRADFADAKSEFKTATQLAPERSGLHFLLGQAYKHLGQQKEAAAEFAEAARLTKAATGSSP